MVQVWNILFCIKLFSSRFRFFDRKHHKFYERKTLCGIKLVWSNGSTDVVGETEEDNSTEDIELYTVSLSEGEHIQRMDLCSSGLIDLMLTSNKGKVFVPQGFEVGLGGPYYKVSGRCISRLIRMRKINPKHLYLDGIRGNVVCPGTTAINRFSFKWSFVVDKMEPPQNYFNPLPPVRSGIKSEKISVLELEKDINLGEGPTVLETMQSMPYMGLAGLAVLAEAQVTMN